MQYGNPFTQQLYAEGKIAILDIRASDNIRRGFHAEMQLFAPWSFSKRLIYYWARLHSEQVCQGEDYELLNPSFTICIVNADLFQDTAYHHRFRVYDDEHGTLLSKDLEIHVLELTKFAVPIDRVQTPLERWCTFLQQGQDLDPDNLPATLAVSEIRRAVEVLMQMGMSDLERERYEERLRAQRDEATRRNAIAFGVQRALEQGREEGITEGITKGIKKGREEGIKQGEQIGRIQLLQQLLKPPETPREELARLSEAELRTLQEGLTQQLRSPTATDGP